MSAYQKLAVLLVLTLAAAARGATNPPAKFTGIVVDEKGRPVADAQVDCYEYPGPALFSAPEQEARQHVKTDSNGAFAMAQPRGVTLLVASKPGLAAAWKAWESAPTQLEEAFVLAAPTVLAGAVKDEKDRPVSDAEVSVSFAMNRQQASGWGGQEVLFGRAAHASFSARTTPDGHFRIEGFPPDTDANLEVRLFGKAMRQGSTATIGYGGLRNHSGDQDIKLALEPEAIIEGRVVAKDNGQPLANARLQLQSGMGWDPTMANGEVILSGRDGGFRIPAVAAGSYRVGAVFTNQPIQDWVSEAVNVTVAAGETARDVRVEATKGAILEVTLTSSADRRGVANAQVSAFSEGHQAQSTTDSYGIALLRLTPGSYGVVANKEGLAMSQTQTTVAASGTNRIKLELSPAMKITGTARDASGAPIAGARVGVFPNYTGGNSEVEADATGHFEVTWQQPSWAGQNNQTYFLVGRSEERNLAAAQEVDEKTSSMDLELKPGFTVTARVQDKSGKPIADAIASLMFYSGNISFQLGNQPKHPDEQGIVRIGALPPGQRYGLSVRAKGYGMGNQTMDAADVKGDHYDFQTITLRPADQKLAGRVLGTDGKPVSGAQVNLWGEGQPSGMARTDADGQFHFDVCQGPVTLNANVQQTFGNADARGGDTNVVIRLAATFRGGLADAPMATTKGKVTDASGRPDEGARITVVPAWGAANTAKSDLQGNYSISWQAVARGGPNAKYMLVARDLGRNLAAAEPLDAQRTQVDLQLQPAITISGTVQDASNAPLSRAQINLNLMSGGMGGMMDQQQIQTDADGAFTIAALPSGQQYNLYISKDGYGSANRGVGPAQMKQTDHVQLPPTKLRLADKEIAGQILGKDGKPLSGAQVMMYGNGQPNANKRSDDAGHFSFKVCDGQLTVQAFEMRAAPGGPPNRGSVMAKAGDMNVVVKMGVNPAQGPTARATLLKDQRWTWGAIVAWPATHKAAMVGLIALQVLVLFGTAVGIFIFGRLRS